MRDPSRLSETIGRSRAKIHRFRRGAGKSESGAFEAPAAAPATGMFATAATAAVIAVIGAAATITACAPDVDPDRIFEGPGVTRIVELTTYEGSGETVHPDVARVLEGPLTGFWLTATPYPRAREKYENPSIWRSDDGISWRETGRPGLPVNPLVNRPLYGYNNDPDLVVAGGELRVFYLDTQRRQYRPDDEHYQDLKVIRSADGVEWTVPTTLLRWQLDDEPLTVSPAVVAVGEGWRVYFVAPKKRAILWWESGDLESFRGPLGTLETGRPDLRPWHLDIFPVDGGWAALLCARGPEALSNTDTDVWLGASRDLESWRFAADPLLAPDERAGLEIVYRSTGIASGDRLALWFSGRWPDGEWGLISRTFPRAIVDSLLADPAN